MLYNLIFLDVFTFNFFLGDASIPFQFDILCHVRKNLSWRPFLGLLPTTKSCPILPWKSQSAQLKLSFLLTFPPNGRTSSIESSSSDQYSCRRTFSLHHFQAQQQWLVGGFNPFEKYLSKWITSPGRDEHKKYLKPPPRWPSWINSSLWEKNRVHWQKEIVCLYLFFGCSGWGKKTRCRYLFQKKRGYHVQKKAWWSKQQKIAPTQQFSNTGWWLKSYTGWYVWNPIESRAIILVIQKIAIKTCSGLRL